MALVLGDFLFLHCPKTGGSYVREVLRPYGASEIGQPHATFNEVDTRGKICFTLVRDPVAWYASYWAHRERTDWPLPQFDRERLAYRVYCADWEFWVEGIIRECPGFAQRYFARYCGPGVIVGHTETLRTDLAVALDLAGLKVTLPQMRVNRSPNLPVVTPELARLIRESESCTEVCHGH